MNEATSFDAARDANDAAVPYKVVVSVVIPMKNEVGSVESLLSGCMEAVSAIGPAEICVTDDASTDGTGEALLEWAYTHPDIRVIILTHARTAGQSAAVHSAVKMSSGRVIVTLDGDGQNPPDQIGRLVAPLLSAPDGSTLGLVAGQRVKRDDPFAKRFASKLANRIRGTLLRDGTPDTGCGLKAFRRDAYLALPYFNHMHRFLPALFQRDGWDIAHVEVTHRPRESGTSKYNNFNRAIVGATDLLGVAWLIRRKKSLRGTDITITRHEAQS